MNAMDSTDDPEPGRLVSLGEEEDRADANDLLGVFRSLAVHQARPRRLGMNKTARECLWWMWEQRRLPRPLIRSKYPMSYPWSPGARATLAAVRESGVSDHRVSGLVIEHLYPARFTMESALQQAPYLSLAEFLALLRQHGAAAVLTREEDRQLSAAGLSSTMPDDWDGVDPWARPRAAGLVPALFEPLGAPPRVERLDEGTANTEHAHEKLELAEAIADRIAAVGGWAKRRTLNQITFRRDGVPPVRVQFWGKKVRLEIGELPEGAALPIVTVPMRRGVSGRCYWVIEDLSQVPTDMTPLLEAASHAGYGTRGSDDNEYETT